MSILAFQIPEKVIMEKANNFHGVFTFKPLEQGYGVTIGNALRRILLSSLEGYAITKVKIPGVLHEFSTIEGIVEDVSEIILNLKMVRFKKISDIADTNIIISISNQKMMTAGDISRSTTSFEILNPDQVICNMDESVQLDMEIIIEKGRGYVSENDNKSDDQNFGFIAIDSIYTPIKNVKYSIENTRVEQKTDYEQLTLDIKTDGSIHPENALKEAANILIQHFTLFSDQNMIRETQEVDKPEQAAEELLHMRKLLKTNLNELDLSMRAYNCLKAANIKTLGDLVSLEIPELLKLRNFGKKSLAELEKLITEKNLTFGMNLSKYKLKEENEARKEI